MADVISFKTRRKLNEQDYKDNDKTTASEGTYLGVLPKEAAEIVRATQENVAIQKAQIDELVDQFEKSYEAYLLTVVNVLTYFGYDVESLSDGILDIRVGEDGHVWLMEKGEKEND